MPTPPRPRGRLRRLDPNLSVFAYLRIVPPEWRITAVEAMSPVERDALDREWPGWRHDGQQPPPEDGWRSWVIVAGRGFGKTLAGANWVTEAVKAGGRLRIALVAATIEQGRTLMVEGKSGLLAVAENWVESWTASRGHLRFITGAEATIFSGADPDELRGPEHHIAWCDELAKWAKPGDTWDMLQLGLRLGDNPRALVTTTPRPGPMLRRIMCEDGCHVAGGRTHDNPHLPAAFTDTVERLYRGTRLGPQELDGQLLPDAGALWTPETLERCRFASPSRSREGLGDGLSDQRHPGGSDPPGSGPPPGPPASGRGGFTRTLIGVDPPTGDGTCGIVACALDADGIGHVLADHSVTARSPEGWAGAVADAARVHGTRTVVAERNQGGKMVGAVLRAAGADLHVKPVHASEGKAARAQPIALLFEAGRVRLHGRFPELEAELLALVDGAPYQGPGGSPDRADAMVWALTELLLGTKAEPRVSTL